MTLPKFSGRVGIKLTAARRVQNALDLLLLSVAYWGAFMVRFDGDLPVQMWKRLLFTWPYVIAFEFIVLSLFNVPRFSWRHIGLREVVRIGWAIGLVTTVLLVVRIIAEIVVRTHSHAAQYAWIPIGVLAVNCALSFLSLVGVRSLRRMLFERDSALRLEQPLREKVPSLLIGAGRAGALVAKEIANRPDLGIRAVGFLDDDPSKKGMLVHGIRVWGTVNDLAATAAPLRAQQVIVTIAEISPTALRAIVQRCESARLKVKILPGLYQVIEEQSTGLGRLRDVSIEDLLGRDAVQLNTELLGSFLRGKRVMVTGAGGSIGSELCRQVAKFQPESLVLVERSEFALFSIHRELSNVLTPEALQPRICDVCDEGRVDAVFALDRPHVVFHAAAHKHVPMMEYNPGEALKNNVFGTRVVADASDRHRCEAFVLISTDKAVNPTSIMGATKRVTEMYVQALSLRSSTKYVAVRFGNVLGSAGSVIPTFREQIAAGGPVTVTHPEMKRYFMTIPEASQLVMQSAAMGRGGEIFVLDMGEPVKIVDLAHDLIRLSGLVPDVDIRVEFVGVRPGEKLFEELGFDAEKMDKTAHPQVYVGKLLPTPFEFIAQKLTALSPFTESTSAQEVRQQLSEIVPEMFTPAPLELGSDTPATRTRIKRRQARRAGDAGFIRIPGKVT